MLIQLYPALRTKDLLNRHYNFLLIHSVNRTDLNQSTSLFQTMIWQTPKILQTFLEIVLANLDLGLL